MPARKWSHDVDEHGDALDLPEHLFEHDDPAAIARGAKRAADTSERRKAEPFRSAMSMPTFYIDRAGDNLPAERRRMLERAKDESRRLYGRETDER